MIKIMVITHVPRAGPARPGGGCARSHGSIPVALGSGMLVNLSVVSFSNTLALSPAEKDAPRPTLLARVDALAAREKVLAAENAALREKLQAPPKTPDNSGTPPSQGRKANGDGKPSPKPRTHAGAHRPLHPNPTRCKAVRA